ncbi:energy transducer TonB [Abyssalbus ytuae]|uniref:Energy transducer TonB n=1 Tax=Abyssalbus ytuae TaxID=2926907 RepID=A0A9E6ZZG2_9FLAO|nr:energy transducer TonB [Abyssalbus ytuae]UOB16701.1 energy transducer TonB [Abyssalbus ytuae]
MSFLDTKHKKKSFTLSSFLLAVIIFLMFYLGLNYTDTPIERGISINFGNTDFGSGNKPTLEKPKTSIQPQEIDVVEEEKILPRENSSLTQEKTEEVITQKTEEVPVIKPEKSIPKENINVVEEPKKVEKPVEEPQKPSKSTTDALSSIINSTKAQDGSTSSNEGNNNKPGNKGNPEGDPYATSYYGAPGSGAGNDAGYGLKGRKLLSRGKVQQECNESGTVVVKIEVDRNGNVIAATPGVKGTSNNDPCLLEPAKKTAFMHRWNVDSNAPDRQIGFVVVNFRLGE